MCPLIYFSVNELPSLYPIHLSAKTLREIMLSKIFLSACLCAVVVTAVAIPAEALTPDAALGNYVQKDYSV